MPIASFPTSEEFSKAFAFLLRHGARIEARDERKLVLTLAQEQALIEAGLLRKPTRENGTNKLGKTTKKKKT
jgi:hypothetical protein